MLKSLTLALLASLVPVQSPAKIEKAHPAIPGRTIILEVDGDYRIEGERDAQSTYESLKKALDEKFSSMFDLKKKLDKVQSETSKLWDEYYALNQAYNRELKKIIAAYVTESNYEPSDTAPTPKLYK